METVLPKLIVGLGNPGGEYIDTRHNLGFMVIDHLIGRLPPGEPGEMKSEAWLWRRRYAGKPVYLAKPQTFMNLSGRSVGKLAGCLNLQPNEILVVVDCLDLPLGRLRLRQAGSSGGHRGMESIIQTLGTDHIPRLRLGIGRAGDQTTVVDHVLSSWDSDERPLVTAVIDVATDAVLLTIRRGLSVTMNSYNQMDVRVSENEPEREQKNVKVDQQGD